MLHASAGGHEQRYPEGHYSRTRYHSCRHRSCPRCAERSRQLWLKQERERLLGCDHFHAIFTVPHELIGVWRYNRQIFAAALFEACRGTLLELLGQEGYLGAKPGIVLALHTWGRTLEAIAVLASVPLVSRRSERDEVPDQGVSDGAAGA